MTEHLAPPEEYDEPQRAAFCAGVRTAARTLALHAKHLHDGTADGEADDTDAEADDEAERCPDCGGELVDAFGGSVCTDCGMEA